ncbi:ATP-dependent DNA helicase RecG [Flavobacterium psychrophilum]|uniref:ATP-dependent DNA helicase RecG n=1 Tax=Flavobacterium psychrophilum TaxID=96345 RepID=UPI0004F5C6F8|nr:ATP-dependent DNA helicase RecG [Flavobacterium psychrophilum]AIN71663.1 ATP-dependent DNA helicase [Flavobacterium psychrophilum FPG101]AIN74736.1 ATP-dependent DNA helicase [Flavobacterium psychrophilum FPG3]AKC19146.1 ATP-dependent DNA helicase [Flavobacterium psychrophilum]AKC23886.1 ATP-dependent DNA helicase [Flavobacterium psychrophilum]AKC28514.1 ATP-dependent DNA helicase [Flavobacterium psychrophilum]
MNNLFETPIEYLKGVGPQRGDLLRKELGVYKYGDLINFYPNRYLDRTKYYKISELQNSSAEVQIIGKVIHIKLVEFAKGKSRLVATFIDDTGQMELVWFQGQKWVKESLKLNVVYVIFGKTTSFNNTFNMAHPEMELLSEHEQSIRLAMQPVYPSTEKLTNRGISNKVVNKMMQQLFSETHTLFSETLPIYLIEELKLISKKEALINIHFPKNAEALAKAQFRLKFEELFFIQLQLITKNLIRKHKIKGFPFDKVGNYFTEFFNNHLPFNLTNAQKRVLKEIRNDMGNPAQMNRLLQGDVGSGKTIVAFMSMLLALDNGFQACLMAPTEILANQHFIGLLELSKPLNINIKILTGSSNTKARKIIHEELENGSLHILIGTHALLEDKVQFKNLGLAIIDEQHRFGVEQRSKLWKKNTIPPHVLVMTATPIPRTLAMSLYGDLDISVIDELPPGRKPIKTVHRFDSNRLKVWHFIREEIEKGRQIYIVYPLIQESEKMDFKDLMDGYESLSRDFPLPKYAISILHGKMKPADKEAEMKRFSDGKTNIMVATTVIEVGVNVPNASVMIIESAERFGLSQLHQLRGRVGRGADQSYCILMTSHKIGEDSKTRMETMVATNDGFEIAEVDLKLRGPGDIMGKQQSGVLNLQIADLVRDKDILLLARNYALKLLKDDAPMEKPEHQTLRKVFIEISKKKNIWNYIS